MVSLKVNTLKIPGQNFILKIADTYFLNFLEI